MKLYKIGVTSSPQIGESDTFPTSERAFAVGKMLTRVNDDMFGSINISKRFTDVEARDAISASNLKANLRSRASDCFWIKLPSSSGILE